MCWDIVGAFAAWNIFQMSQLQFPTLYLFLFVYRGGQRWQIAFAVRMSSSFLCTSHVSARPRNLVQWLSPVILRFLHSIALKCLIQVGKAIASRFVVLLIIFCLQCLRGKKHQLLWTFLALLPGRQWGGTYMLWISKHAGSTRQKSIWTGC